MERPTLAAAGQLTRLRSVAFVRRSRVSPRCLSSGTRAPIAKTYVKPYYVTTPIFYVNSTPHIGHMYSMLLGDVLKRWQVLNNKKALLCTGTDEHGMKIQRAAALQDLPPKQFCDANAATFKNLAQLSQIDYDFFVRTTDSDHAEAVQHFWTLLREKGYIYEAKHEGWYCVSDEVFYPESEIERRVDDFTGKVYMASKESGHALEWVAEKNWHFRMTDLKDQLLRFYERNPDWINPPSKLNEVRWWVERNLQDLSISRPVSRLNWGIPVPGDPTQTIYVWLDALINYIAKAGFPDKWQPGHNGEGGWPADVHVIGKDILRFHCVYWPALLLALEMPLPKRILCHSHWTLSHGKISKSRGNAVNPFFAISRFGVDTMRFYLMHDGPLRGRDAEYGNLNIIARYQKVLQGNVGNLLGRVTQSRLWNLAEVVKAAAGVADFSAAKSEIEDGHVDIISGLPSGVAALMDEANPGEALRKIVSASDSTNALFSDAEPWKLLKKGPATRAEDRLLAQRSIFLAAESLRIIGILLQPFIPTKAGQLLDALGVDESRRDISYARLSADSTYGTPSVSLGKGRFESLFPPLELEEDET